MRILYAVQATGNGHISRAAQIYPYLQKYGKVDFFLSGSNASLPTSFPVAFKSKGCSLHYSKCGGLDYVAIAKNIHPLRVYKEARSLELKKYDVIINDFEAITALACKIQKVHSVQLGHQASFISDQTPRPDRKSIMGEFILKNYAQATQNIGLHFQKYDENILPPIIKDEILNADPSNQKHITVYLPSFDRDCLEKTFQKLKHLHFQWFLPEVTFEHTLGNITYLPVQNKRFNQSLIHCEGIITGGGFETPAEAMYLKKKILSIPILKHYEQECNAAALRKLGVKVLQKIDTDFEKEIRQWIEEEIRYPELKANNIATTLEYLFDTYKK